MKKMAVLKQGDKIGIVAPSALFKKETLQAGVRLLKSKGFVPVLGKNLMARDFIYSGTSHQRVESFLDLAYRDDIKAIWCIRGGYGSWVVASAIAESKAPSTPKTLIGFSDITTLHLAVQKYWKWPALHGPLFSRFAYKSPAQETKILFQTLEDPSFRLHVTSGLKKAGTIDDVEGLLVGGNLTLLVSSLKTPWEFQARGKILFFEDVGERAYRIDRMLYQLKCAGKFDGLKGLVIGDFTECTEPDGKEIWQEVLKRHFKNAPYPVLLGLRSGHGELCLPLPLGARARVSTRHKPEFQMI